MTAHPKPVVVKDPDHLAFIRTLPCVNHGRCDPSLAWTTIGAGPSEASHLAGKSRDDLTVPMCGGCHRTSPFAWHNGKESYCSHFGVTEDDLWGIASDLWDRY